jgi:hypothetical protein
MNTVAMFGFLALQVLDGDFGRKVSDVLPIHRLWIHERPVGLPPDASIDF